MAIECLVLGTRQRAPLFTLLRTRCSVTTMGGPSTRATRAVALVAAQVTREQFFNLLAHQTSAQLKKSKPGVGQRSLTSGSRRLPRVLASGGSRAAPRLRAVARWPLPLAGSTRPLCARVRDSTGHWPSAAQPVATRQTVAGWCSPTATHQASRTPGAAARWRWTLGTGLGAKPSRSTGHWPLEQRIGRRH
jgi:hypothetical protein